MMKGREKIIIDTSTRGKLVFAKYIGKNKLFCNWLILISNVTAINNEEMLIKSYISHAVNKMVGIQTYFDKDGGVWSMVLPDKQQQYEFYTVTKEEKKAIAEMITKEGYKFVKVLNKLIPR